MTKEVVIEGISYTITNEGKYSVKEELIFEIWQGKERKLVLGMWDDILGLPVRMVWKIVDSSIKD
jgi:hypothetical protein